MQYAGDQRYIQGIGPNQALELLVALKHPGNPVGQNTPVAQDYKEQNRRLGRLHCFHRPPPQVQPEQVIQ